MKSNKVKKTTTPPPKNVKVERQSEMNDRGFDVGGVRKGVRVYRGCDHLEGKKQVEKKQGEKKSKDIDSQRRQRMLNMVALFGQHIPLE